jgi:hypothetical protein
VASEHQRKHEQRTGVLERGKVVDAAAHDHDVDVEHGGRKPHVQGGDSREEADGLRDESLRAKEVGQRGRRRRTRASGAWSAGAPLPSCSRRASTPARRQPNQSSAEIKTSADARSQHGQCARSQTHLHHAAPRPCGATRWRSRGTPAGCRS